ncbi:hypothetical protein OF83DRAFT_162573 [Amylostereum chailletii]|nr:hypothetical protein OF83DRAFT_162573 [Amylostereum chailletii]
MATLTNGTHPLELPTNASSAEVKRSQPLGDAGDEEEEEFVYPAVETEEEEFRYPDIATNEEANSVDTTTPQAGQSSRSSALPSRDPSPPPVVNTSSLSPSPPQQSTPSRSHPSPAQLESLYAAASSGDLSLLQRLVRTISQTEEIEPFSLANDASTRTGLTALHAAASRGHLSVVKWLVNDCGAMPDLEDKEGEAALQGHMSIIEYLLPEKADVHARDADGWSALHNACSKGYLDIVRWLCEHGGATAEVDGAPGVDVRSQGGWTPLMNAASKGHLPIVLYLLTKQSANPLVRNNWGETAYDAAAAVFEVWICEVLSRFEAEKWRGTTVPYDPLAVHTTVPLLLYENQRLDMRLKTLAMSGGRPRFTASGLGKHGRRPPFELKLPITDEETSKKTVAAWRSDVQLPLREDPLKLPIPGSRTQTAPEGAERSHFWLSDWTLDVTHPGVDAETGWQYSQSFDDPDEQWTPEPPAQLERLLHGTSVVTGFGSPTVPGSRSRSNSRHLQSWVRRRRWVRVMRRRLDIPPLPFLGPDGGLYHWLSDGTMVSFEETINDFGDMDGQELESIPSNPLTSAQDYIARARYLAGEQNDSDEIMDQHSSAIEARRAIAKLERATTELRQGALSDDNVERKTQAEVLLNAYSRELERRRLAAGAQGLLLHSDDQSVFDDDDDDDDDEFHYPGSSPVETMRAPSVTGRSYTTDYFGRGGGSRGPTDLTPHLSQAPEFRVPTHEAPQKVITPMYTPPTPHEVHARWERDHHVQNCRDCQRRFTFLVRRHHCRRCGRIFCDRCSSYRTLLDPSDIVHDPTLPETSASASSQRVCLSCYEAVTVNVPPRFQENRVASMERIFIDQGRLSIPRVARQSSSQLSDLNDCPVCSRSLAELGPPPEQEAHVRSCLEGGTGKSPQVAKYLVYKLPSESALIGTECVICLEEFVTGSTVARLSCLCSFHNGVIFQFLDAYNHLTSR